MLVDVFVTQSHRNELIYYWFYLGRLTMFLLWGEFTLFAHFLSNNILRFVGLIVDRLHIMDAVVL